MTTRPGPIARVAWQSFRVPFAAAAQTSRSTLAVREGFILTVTTADGMVGVGEASPLDDFEGGRLDEVGLAIERMAAGLLGRTPDEVWSGLELAVEVAEPSLRVARAGFEATVASIAAEATEQPLWAWLADRSGIEVPAHVAIPANALIDVRDPAGIEEAVRVAARAGYQTVKLKVGGDARNDLQRVAAARQAAEDLELRVDANGGWDDRAAAEALNAFEAYAVALCEQPFDPRRPDAIEATARLRREVRIPVALDESCRTPHHVRRAIAAGAADAIVVKPMFTGLIAAIEMIQIAREGNVRCIVTTTFDTGVGTAMARHVAALLREPRAACGIATLARLGHPLVLGGALADGPTVSPPEGPGIGVELDRDALTRFAGEICGAVGD